MLSRTAAPRSLDELQAHLGLKDKIIQHSVVYGPEGCGKLTLAQCWLASIYGDGVHRMQRRSIEISNQGQRRIDVPFFASHFHVVVDAPTCNSIDKTALQQFVREMSTTHNVVSMVNSRADSRLRAFRHKVVVVRGADAMSNGSQSALRDILEKRADACRVILLTRNIAQMQDLILSRCLKLKVRPDPGAMLRRASDLCAVEGIPQNARMRDFVAKCRGNWRRLLGDMDYVKHGLRTWEQVLSGVDERTLLAQQVASRIDAMAVEGASLAAGVDVVRELTHSASSIGIAPSWLMSVVCTRLVEAHPGLDAALLRIASACDYAMTQGTQPVAYFDRFTLEAALCIATAA
jgi:hypothetical protein